MGLPDIENFEFYFDPSGRVNGVHVRSTGAFGTVELGTIVCDVLKENPTKQEATIVDRNGNRQTSLLDPIVLEGPATQAFNGVLDRTIEQAVIGYEIYLREKP